MAFEDDVIELMQLTASLAERRAGNYRDRDYDELLAWSERLLAQSESDLVRSTIRDSYARLTLDTSFLDEEALDDLLDGDNRAEDRRLTFLWTDQETGAGIVAQGIHGEVVAVNSRISSLLDDPPQPPRNYLQSALKNAETVFGSLRDLFDEDPKVKALFAIFSEFAGIFAA